MIKVEIELKSMSKKEAHKLFDDIYKLTKKHRKSEINGFLFLRAKDYSLSV